MPYEIYVADTETTGLDARLHDVIELSILRLSTGQQKTWSLKPTNVETIEPGALRVNGHKREDLCWETKIGKETYLDPNVVLVDVENWLGEDGLPSENRVMCGQNVAFDRDFLQQLWVKCNSKDSFPFGRRSMDTMMIAFFLDWCKGEMAEGYSLANLAKRYGIVNSKAHTAAADTLTTKCVFEEEVKLFKKVLAKSEDTICSSK
jgi:DNA polymerase III epsilon subunit-like protein